MGREAKTSFTKAVDSSATFTKIYKRKQRNNFTL